MLINQCLEIARYKYKRGASRWFFGKKLIVKEIYCFQNTFRINSDRQKKN